MVRNSMYDSQPSNANYLLPTAYRFCLLSSVFCACIYGINVNTHKNQICFLFCLNCKTLYTWISYAVNLNINIALLSQYIFKFQREFPFSQSEQNVQMHFFITFPDVLYYRMVYNHMFLLPWNRYVMDRETPICHVFKTWLWKHGGIKNLNCRQNDLLWWIRYLL